MKEKREALLIAGVLGALILGLSLWYMATHPAPVHAPISVEPQTRVVTDEGDYHRITAEFPTDIVLPLASDSAAGGRAEGVMTQWLNETITTFKSESRVGQITPEEAEFLRLTDGRKYTLDAMYQMYFSRTTQSYVFTLFQDTMGAHPLTFYKTFTFDASTGNEMVLADFFVPGSDFLGALSRVSREKLPQIIAEKQQSEANMDYLESGTMPVDENFQTFLVDGNVLVLVFPPYQVGPYVLGTITLPIPFEELSDIVRPEYLEA